MVEIKAKHDTWLKKQPISSSELHESKKMLIKKGQAFSGTLGESKWGHFQIELDWEAGTWWLFPPHWDISNFEKIVSGKDLVAIMPSIQATDVSLYLDPLNEAMNEFHINTPLRAAAFLAQLAHESGQFRYKEEIASGAAYEGRDDLGNTKPGDGERFKGRGLIQITGRYNYREAGKALGYPLEEKPELVVEDPYINVAVATWFWDTRKLNKLADQEKFTAITRRINGGLNGQYDREKYYNRAKKALGA